MEFRLNCTRCAAFVEYHHVHYDPDPVVRCDGCGKKHSKNSAFMVDPDRRYDRDEAGTLIDERIPK